MESTISALRPMRLGEILDQAIRLYRRNFVTFIGILALVYIPVQIIQTAVTYLTTSYLGDPSKVFTATYWLTLAGFFVMLIVQFVLVQGIATAALTRAVADNYLGKPIGIVDAYKKLGSAWARLLGALVLMVLLMLGILISTIVPCAGWLVGPGAFVFLVWSVNPLIAPAVMLEQKGGGEAIRRAWDLARRRFWWLLGFMFVLFLFSQLVMTGPTLLVNYSLMFILGPETVAQSPLISTIVGAVVSLVGGLLYLPLQLTASTLVYFDLRVRTEGFDLALLSMQASGEHPDMDTIHELPSQAPVGRAVEWSDVGNFVILTIGFVAGYVILVTLFTAIILALATALGGL